MRTEHLTPAEIEKKSFEMISAELEKSPAGRTLMEESGHDPAKLAVIKRCIHTTADFDYVKNMRFSADATRIFQNLIKKGASVVTDTNMALSGINRRILDSYGCRAYCFMADEEIAKEAKMRQITRASVSMERAMKLEGPVIFVIGNAPTALITIREHYDQGDFVPAFVIGMPVGFVNVVAAKEMIMETNIPYIVGQGQKGGSNVAAAVVNALLYHMEKSRAGIADMPTNSRGIGFTTGSCAAAAAKAAAYMLLGQKKIDSVSIDTPAGLKYEPRLEGIMLTKRDASCAVRKPKCDDPDVTAGILIYAKAEYALSDERVIIEGGCGIGKITKPGLDQSVGEYAINSVPRKMIKKEVESVIEEFDHPGAIRITISAPEGEKIAEKTFNPNLGIEGGISIIGTSGLIEPMSTKALIDTIRVSMRQQRLMGAGTVVVIPGNYGLDYMKNEYEYDPDRAVKCSNFVGEAIDIAREMGFEGMLLTGNIGKLIKVTGGIMNTDSARADCRMELMAAAAVRSGADSEMTVKILDSVSTEEACGHICGSDIEKECFSYITERIEHHLKKRAKDMEIGCIVYSSRFGKLGETENAQKLLEEARG